MSNFNVLLVGGGVTSSLIAFLLRHHNNFVFDVWERQLEIGGRMRVLRSEHSFVNIDLGAQYVTTTDTYLRLHKNIYDFLISNSIIEPLTNHIENLRVHSKNNYNYVAGDGMSSLVKHFFANSNIRNIRVSHSLSNLNVQGDIIIAKSTSGAEQTFDAVVITVPVPNIFEINGTFKSSLTPELSERLKKVKYSSRFVLVLVFDRNLDVPWAATYLPHDKLFRYAAIQEKKISYDTCRSSVVFHTSIEFGTLYNTPEEAQPILLQQVHHIFPQWQDPIEVHCHKWDYSQVISPYEDSPFVVLSSHPLIILTGDGFSTSNFDGCITAATSTTDTILNILKNS